MDVPNISQILNSDLIQLTHDKVCNDFSTASTEDIFNPTLNTEKSTDIGLVITVNYNSLYKIIPIIEVSDNEGFSFGVAVFGVFSYDILFLKINVPI